MAHLVMETISELQKGGKPATLRDVKNKIVEKYGEKSEKVMRLVPQYVLKGINLGLIAKFGDNLRTKMYLAKRRRRKIEKKGRRRRRRTRHGAKSSRRRRRR